MIILLSTASVQFGLSVEISDACDDMASVIVNRLNYTSVKDTNTVFEPEITQIAEYYIYCDNDESYPENILQTRTEYSINKLDTLTTSVASLQREAEGTDVEVELLVYIAWAQLNQ